MYIERVLSFQSMCFEDSTMFKTVLHIREKIKHLCCSGVSQYYCHHVFCKISRKIKYDIETWFGCE